MYSGSSFEKPINERPTSLERPLDSVNLIIKVLISSADERSLLLKGYFSGEKSDLKRGIIMYRKSNHRILHL